MNLRILLTTVGLTLLLLSACSNKPDPEPGPAAMQRYTLEHDGLLREYFVFLPTGYDETQQYPVAIFMHGYGGTATGTEAEVTQGLNQYAEEFGYVMVYPQGTWFMSSVDGGEPWEVTSWNHISDGFDSGPAGPICEAPEVKAPCPPECGDCGQCGWSSCHDDVGFLRALVADITGRWSVAAGRVHVTGFSNGAMMANRIACEASEMFASVALVGGRLEPGFECTPTNRLPLLQINGGADDIVPADGRISTYGSYFASTTSVTRHWNEGMACGMEPEDWSSPVIKNANVQCTIACGNTEHASIDCLWPEGNHRWPGTADFRGSNGYCVSELQARSMPDQPICIEPEDQTNFWGSRLLFEFFNMNSGE
jgi:polyhydroxybutyrate depolymerase